MTQLGPRPSSAQAARPAAAAKLVGALLCGGASRRMGRDKARLELDGRTLLERASSLLGGSCTRMLLCCGAAPRYTELGVPLALDAPGESGPLAGVAAALATLASDELLVVAPVDLPWLDAQTLALVVARLRSEDCDAACARSHGGLEPLVSAWRPAALPEVRAALARGDRRMVAPFAGWSESGLLRLAIVEFDASGLHRTFDNLNTPLDWRRATMETGDEAAHQDGPPVKP